MSEAASITVRVPLAIRRQPGPSITSMAAERIDRGYLGRILQLTLLAPDIVEAILDGRQPADLGMARLLASRLAEWEQLRESLRMAPLSRAPALP